MKRRKKRGWQVLCALAIAILGVAFLPVEEENVYAKEIVVGTEDELRNAISNGENGDVINIKEDIVVKNQIDLDKSLTINGNGHMICVSQPGMHESGILNSSVSNYRVFNAVTEATEIQVNRLIISGGKKEGGAIYIGANVTVILDRVTITNSGGDAETPGGGILNSGTIYIKDSMVSRNAARHGGGFLNSGTMVIENSCFSENRSLSDNGGGGAGENQGQLYINNCTFANNKSTELGGAINDYGGMAYIMNSTFSGNISYSTEYGGGALRGSKSVVVNCMFTYNYRLDGDKFSLSDYDSSIGDISTYNSLSNYRMVSSLTHGEALTGYKNYLYAGNSDGSDNNIFTNGILTKVLAADGSEIETGMVYQPMIYTPSGKFTSIAPLCTPIPDFLNGGVATAFDPKSETPIFAYQNKDDNKWYNYYNNGWSTLEPAPTQLVTTDQIGEPRGNVIGGTGHIESNLYMVKLIYKPEMAHGLVHGATVFGNTYSAGAEVTMIALPEEGYYFDKWLNEDGTEYSSDNPLTITVKENVTLYPTYLEGTAQTEPKLETNIEEKGNNKYQVSATLTESDDLEGQPLTFYVRDEEGRIVYSETRPTDGEGKVIFSEWEYPSDGVIYQVYVAYPGNENNSSCTSDNLQLKAKINPNVAKIDTVQATYGDLLEELEIEGESADIEGTFKFKGDEGQLVGDVGEQKVTRWFIPEDSDNYTSISWEITVNVVPKLLTYSNEGQLVKNKEYNGDNLGQLSDEFKIEGVLDQDGDDIEIKATATFEDKDAGKNKEVMVSFEKSGTASDNYQTPDGVIDYANIEPKPLKGDMVQNIADVIYTGSPQEPVPELGDGDPSIIATSDYTIRYKDNTSVGTAKTIIEAAPAGNYSGSVEKEFQILPVKQKVQVTPYEGVYDGKDHSIKVEAEGAIISYSLEKNDLLTVAQPSVKPPMFRNAGVYTVYYLCKRDNYEDVSGHETVTITKKPLTVDMFLPIKNQIYSGKGIKPEVIIEETLLSSQDIRIQYQNNIKVGKASIIISATKDSNFSGSVTLDFEIVQRKTKPGDKNNTSANTGDSASPFFPLVMILCSMLIFIASIRLRHKKIK